VTSYSVQQLGGQIFDVVPIKTSIFGYGKKSYRVDANMEAEIYSCE
jgi:hypothetical protein